MSATIVEVELLQVDLPPRVPRSDAIQSFVTQETPMVRIRCDDGTEGTGYAYTIGTGGSSVMALLRDHLAPRLIGRDPAQIEAIWRELLFATHATSVGAITSLALAAIDTALWDWRCRRDGQPLWLAAGGAQPRVPVYTTEGGWLHLDADTLVSEAVAAREAGFRGAKLKVGRTRASEDVARLAAVRAAVGDGFELMVDANQCFTAAEAIRRAPRYAELGIAWFEEPLPADDIGGHVRLAASTPVPIAVGESLYSPGQFAEYVRQGACGIVQADVARIGGITPWLKVAHLAEAHNLSICPHFLMELHVSLCAAVPNAAWVEYIPQLDEIAASSVRIEAGHAIAPDAPGLGIEWDWAAIGRRTVARALVS
ncbi:mandelate racemase/muconate lactonizing enzyme family protein [Cupriavidus basilensis]|uniref:Mandelate racemase/muconate lactonizing enzyme family protein n=1 Tax=Cupriavidus basilensis TaxID=68895 RepID=A0A643FRS8_9BURK|nr:mandelate racemase/muconate lactonizing enzyme family protein [Cupriavidus basilensis]QOT79625.1 mandelate racemase/muconate lactonizing enzyme family protein [Cupriavidus basilensis]